MKRFLRSKLVLSLVAIVMLTGGILISFQRSHIPVVHAANGDLVHETHFSTPCQSGVGVGIAFDGTNLWYSCYASNPDLYKSDPLTGNVIASYNIAGGLGALAWDGTRNKLWAAWGGGSGATGDIRQIDTTTGTSFVKFNASAAASIDLDDGLAYDALDDSLLISPDTSTTIYHYSSAGNLLDNFSWSGSGCYNSGVAIGGSLLFEGSDGCNHIWVVNRSDRSPAFDFTTGADGVRDEGMSCDDVTFAPKTVMWSMEAYEPRRTIAYEIPPGSCGFGGKPSPGNSALYDFKQNVNSDGTALPWADKILYNDTADGCPDMADAGCAITSVADVIASYGLKSLPPPEPANTPVDPLHLNQYFGQVPDTHSGCGINFEPAGKELGYKMDNYMPGKWSMIDPSTNKPFYPGDFIDKALEANELVILGMHVNNPNKSHFIVVYRGTFPAADGSPDYYIVDPFRYFKNGSYIDNSGKTLSQAYGTLNQLIKAGDGLQVVVVENASAQQWTSWAVVAHSPVQMIITDPNGAQTGYDPTTGKNFLNIPESSYGIKDPIDDSGTLPPQPSELYFGQNDVKDGTYKVQVIGTGTGPYKLDFAIASPGKSTLQALTGTATPGQIDTYNVSFAQGHLENIVRQVSIDIKPGEDPAAISPTSTGKTAVALLSTPTFDATKVSLSTIKFGPANAPAVDKQLDIEDVNGDGLPDVVFHFVTKQTGIKAGDIQACLIGQMTNGTNITGCDTIQTVSSGS